MTTNTPEYKVVVTPTGNRLIKVTPINRVKKQTALDYENSFQTPEESKKLPSKSKLFVKFLEDIQRGQQFVTWFKDKGEQRRALIQCSNTMDVTSGSLLVHNVSIALGVDEHENGSTNTFTRIPVNSITEYSNNEVCYHV